MTDFRKLSVEPLESRAMLAGNVTAKISGGDVLITGDGSSNKFEVRQTNVLDKYEVVGLTHAGSATKINGRVGGKFTFWLSSFNDDMIIKAGAGNDVVTVRGSSWDYIADLDIHDDLVIDMGTGSDTVIVRYVDVGKDLLIRGHDMQLSSATTDRVTVDRSWVGDDLRIDNKSTARKYGKTFTTLTNLDVEDQIDIDTLYSTDVVNIVSVDADDLLVDLNARDDKLNVKRSYARVFKLDGGSGNDDLNFFSNRRTFTGVNFKSPTRKDITYA